MKYFKYSIFFFCGMSFGFFVSFWVESLNPDSHEGALLFESFAWYTSMFLAGICGFIAGRGK
ncbi:hypothetical protein [Leptospira alexanderi]|uniref:hypothetical protein n=1 Tax=Leptospira alexanderi TaxID=100053 RepID=UPI0009914A82|nr:hypothetical protein [Leptospira alexanderi]